MSAPSADRAVGAAVPRVEGQAKVTGAARYAADNSPPGMLHAVLVGASIARGTILAMDTRAAVGVDDVVRVLTAADMPSFGGVGAFMAGTQRLPMQSDEVRFEGEPVAIVLATTLEAAEQARALVTVRYDAQPPILPGAGEREPVGPDEPFAFGSPFQVGDAAAGLASAAVRVAATYVQPSRHHNPMETSGTLASWAGDELTVWDSVQASSIVPPVLADALGIEPRDVHVISPHTGGGFGAKGYVWPHQVLAAAAARLVERPVKLHLRRPDQYTASGFQPLMTQRIELGAAEDGRLTALRHRVSHIASMGEKYVERSTEVKALYACPAIDTSQDIEHVSVGMPTPMRSPVEGCGLWALESAMNELAHELGIDPLELRLRNYAEIDPVTGRPWSSKRLHEAYAEGAKLFGWHERAPGGRSEGHWRIGTGMATSTQGVVRWTGSARVRLRRDGTARIEADVQDIGTGVQTVLTQVAADELDLRLSEVSVAWGDSRLPMTGPLYGSAGTIHTGSAVALACRDLRRKLSELSGATSVADAIREAGVDEVVGEGSFGLPGGAPIDADGGDSGYAMRTWGAVFVEVGVDPHLGLVRLRRAVGSYSAGRIMNARTARSQMIGSIVWGWGKATMERSEQDPATGRWLSKNLSGVHLPTNADIPGDIAIHFVDEFDAHASRIGAKGIGEIGATGVDAAIADAVFDAVGVRIRELPITPKRVLSALTALGT